MGLLDFIFGKKPDMGGVNRAAEASSKTGADSLAWAKQIFAEQAPDRAAAAALDTRVANSQIAGMDFATQQARESADRNKTVFQPIEDKLAAGALNYDTPERRAAEAARAGADVERNAGMAMAEMRRDTLRRGGSLDDGGARGGAMDLALGTARARAGATDMATRNVEQQGYARMADAANMGRGLASSQATQQQIASNTGSAATAAAGAGLGATMAGNQGMQQGFGQAMQGYGQAGSLYGQAASLKTQMRGQDMNFLSDAFGSYMKSSSKKIKKNVKGTDEDAALDEVNALAVKDYDYDPAKGGPPGMGPQTGPMAEDVRATMGEEVAPGGKAIDMLQMGGKLMASMQALTKRIERIEKAVA